MTTEDICRALYNAKYRYHNEKELQQGVSQLLDGLGLEYEPEVPMGPRNRIDFLVSTGLGIECKSDDSAGGTSLASDFRRYLYGMDLLLQPSFTETFNNVTADGVAAGVPSVVSPAITWAPSSWTAQPDSALDVARVGESLLSDPKAPAAGQAALDAHNSEAIEAWRRWLIH